MHNLLQVVEWSTKKFVGLGLQVTDWLRPWILFLFYNYSIKRFESEQ